MSNNPFKESNELIEKFMKENELAPMHFEMYLQQKHDIVCFSKEENEDIDAKLDRLRELES